MWWRYELTPFRIGHAISKRFDAFPFEPHAMANQTLLKCLKTIQVCRKCLCFALALCNWELFLNLCINY